MMKLLWKSLLVAPVVLGTVLTLGSVAQANDDQLLNEVEIYGTEGLPSPVEASQEQVTSVNQLRDVEPTAWAFEALRSLVERYGCIVGYPDRTFRGDRALTRWEFAAGLNACMNVMERLIQEGVGVAKEDIDKLKRLMEEYQAELAALGARVDNLESRVSFLEDHQFSTTTKLGGEVIFAVTDTFSNSDTTQTTFQSRVRLTFNTSFTGSDRLVTRLAAGTGSAFDFNYHTTGLNQFGDEARTPFDPRPTPTTTQTFNLVNAGGGVEIDWLAYYLPVTLGPLNFNGYVAAFGAQWYDFVPTNNPFFQDFDGGNGALSTFAQQNPIYRIGTGGGGAGLNFSLGFAESILGPTSVSLGYLSGTAPNPDEGAGLFNGDYAALAQINFNLFNFLNVGATYVHSYLGADTPLFGNAVGTEVSNLSQSNLNNAMNAPNFFDFGGKVSNSYGLQGSVRLTDNISFNAFGLYSDVILLGRGDVEVWSYGAGVAVADIGREGSIAGLFAGVQPYSGRRALPGASDIRFSQTKPLHIELFYKYQVTDNISITPGVIWIYKPSQARSAEDVFIGTLRGTFNF
jgi:hypothetical protein